MLNFKTIEKIETGMIVEKKSKFIATIIPVKNRIEADEKIKEIKKQYADARHNCYAYCVIEDDTKITKSSDDGEPSGTAGIPILKVIVENNLCNVLVVVTRYFGGILLGTGGLVRAYTQSTLEAINNSKIIQKGIGYEITIEIEYSDLNYLKYYIEKNDGKIVKINYSEKIQMIIEINDKTEKEITNTDSEIGKKINKIYEKTRKYITIQGTQ